MQANAHGVNSSGRNRFLACQKQHSSFHLAQWCATGAFHIEHSGCAIISHSRENDSQGVCASGSSYRTEKDVDTGRWRETKGPSLSST